MRLLRFRTIKTDKTMLIAQCDFCKKETKDFSKSKNDVLIPERWITIVGAIHNELPNKKMLYCSEKTLHFCSLGCLNQFLCEANKNETPCQ